MPDFTISRNSIKRLYIHCLLGSFALFLIAGNFFRLIQLSIFPSHFSFAEGLLYALAFPFYFLSFKKSSCFFLLLILSSLYGAFNHGFDFVSSLFPLKLIGMIASGVAIGDALYLKYSLDFERCLGFIIRIFSGVLILGTLIFLLFSNAQAFFCLLKEQGIHFLGDPHQKRFISPFFDPNFYSAIACIPLLCCWLLRNKKRRYFYLSIAFFLSIILTWSRSGIATCLFTMILISSGGLLHLKSLFVSLRRFVVMGFFWAILASLLFIYSEEFGVFSRRLIHFLDDNSAYARLVTFQYGVPYFLQYPFFGMGYNYLAKLLYEDFGKLGIDSSLFITLINFGLIPCLGLGCIALIWSIRRWKRFFKNKKSQQVRRLFGWLYIYLFICILFTCQFNNLLYYQYWLIPVIALFTYLDRWNENSTRS